MERSYFQLQTAQSDYQSRRLKIRYKEEGQNKFVHMVNGTAIASTRAIIAILENSFQMKREALEFLKIWLDIRDLTIYHLQELDRKMLSFKFSITFRSIS